MKKNVYTYPVEVLSVYDGDTFTVMVDVGFNTYRKLKLRLARVDTPEIRTRDKLEKARGYEAKKEVVQLFAENPDQIFIQTLKKGKYGRWIAEVQVGEINLSDWLVSQKLAEYKEY